MTNVTKVKRAKKPALQKHEIEITNVRQLKFWLHGIKEFQDLEWVPDANQWKRIYETIMRMPENPTFENMQPNSPHPVAGNLIPPPSLFGDPNAVGGTSPMADLTLAQIRAQRANASETANLLGNGALISNLDVYVSPLI